MPSIARLKKNIREDEEKTKYILYNNRLTHKEFYIPVKSDREINNTMNDLDLYPWIQNSRVVTFRPKRATRR